MQRTHPNSQGYSHSVGTVGNRKSRISSKVKIKAKTQLYSLSRQHQGAPIDTSIGGIWMELHVSRLQRCRGGTIVIFWTPVSGGCPVQSELLKMWVNSGNTNKYNLQRNERFDKTYLLFGLLHNDHGKL